MDKMGYDKIGLGGKLKKERAEKKNF